MDKPIPSEQNKDKSDQDKDKTVYASSSQAESLKKSISETIEFYRKKRKRNKIGAIVVQTLSILFSFGTTVIIGWKLGVSSEDVPKEGSSAMPSTLTGLVAFTNFALVISALATGINALDKFFDYKALWIGYNISIANLKSLQKKMEYITSAGAENVKQLQLDEIFERFELICANMDKIYREVRMSRDE